MTVMLLRGVGSRARLWCIFVLFSLCAILRICSADVEIMRIDSEGGVTKAELPADFAMPQVALGAQPRESSWESFLLASDPVCGANSLFMYLRLRNVNVKRQDILDNLPIGEEGSSMLDLKRVAEAHGVPSVVLSCAPDELSKLELPILARLGDSLDGGLGHYVVVTNADDETVTYRDGTTGGAFTVDAGDFNQTFSGYLLTPERARWPNWIVAGLAVVVFIQAVSMAERCLRRERTTVAPR